jgi:hypothetical protein
MNHSHFRRLASVLTALAVVMADIVGGPVACAWAYPARGQWARPRHPIPFPPHAHAAAAGGVASWLVVLILAAAAPDHRSSERGISKPLWFALDRSLATSSM